MQDQHQNQNVIQSHQQSFQIQNVDIEEVPLEDQIEDSHWLSKEFNRIPFLLYKLWLVLNFVGAFVLECCMLYKFRDLYKIGELVIDQILYIYFQASLILLIYGCGQMLFAIIRRKSSAAQRSFLKLQYFLVAALISLALSLTFNEKASEVERGLVNIAVISSIIHLLGGQAVLRTFKKNHPLLRRCEALEVSDPLLTDFYEQNEAISSEISKYEQKLNSWPCLIYNWWLKLAVVFEISMIFGYIFSFIAVQLFQGKLSLPLFLSIGALILSLLNAYSRIEMEVAMRTRALARSKRAVLLLKISILSSMLLYLFIATHIDWDQEMGIIIPPLGRFGFFIAIPGICLAGAIKVHKLIEEREPFVKASSYNSELYL